ncbi:hypothetical protein E2C01_056605 [Portunus trituberculatus]|uniref:Uncharacterized protein n=1 Tax=Portunus trituberculatus TaxID=210409 RepID=A0A5B7GY51_PORTR|nr:hypothetical protein [Portunus trituberculatus]
MSLPPRLQTCGDQITGTLLWPPLNTDWALPLKQVTATLTAMHFHVEMRQLR